MAMLPVAWFLIWAFGELAERWRFLAALAGTMALFVGVGEALAPGWVGDFIAGLQAYRHYYPTTSILRVAIGDTAGMIAGALIVLAIVIFGWSKRSVSGRSQAFVLMFAFFSMTAVLAFPIMTIYNHCLLILPALLVVQEWRNLSKVSRVIFSALISWYWIMAFVLLLIHLPSDLKNTLVLLPSISAVVIPLALPVLLWGTLRTAVAE